MRPFTAYRIVVLLLAAIGLAAARGQEPSRAEADAMETKLQRMEAATQTPRAPSAPPLRTSFTEREINAHFVYYGPSFLPAGIAEPRMSIGEDGRVVARALVDLDAVRLARERSLLDPLAYLRGSLEVVAAGTVAGADGAGVVRFESATVGGVAVPKTVAQELLRFYTRSPERPAGVAFDTPFPLPRGLRAVSTARGSVTVTQ